MPELTAKRLRTAFLDFFRARGHAVIPSASLLPENDPSVLFTTAGMHPLVPFILGEPHPQGRRLANVQKCIRTQDIDEVGDHRHSTFFEMLGAWSLGDYFNESIVPWTLEFFTTQLGLDRDRLSVTVFEGDDETATLWRDLGITRISHYGRDKNWWGPAGETGPCGPDTEIFFDTGKPHDPRFGETCHPNCDCGRYVEIGNDVLMRFTKTREGTYEELSQRTVDVGWGLERLLAVTTGKSSIFETELFAPAIRELERLSRRAYSESPRPMEVIADHVRAATFILADPRGITPSNVDQGYVLRRFIRRAIRHARQLGITRDFLEPIAMSTVETLGDVYPELGKNIGTVCAELESERRSFQRTLIEGERQLEKLLERKQPLSGKDAFHLYETWGFPLELTEETAREHHVTVDREGYLKALEAHQKLSRTGAAQKFAGGLADSSDRTVRLHTATHLLHTALRQVLGGHVEQRGSNITTERLRFDFPHPQKPTPEQLQAVERIVNEQIDRDLPITWTEMSVADAKSRGVIGIFEDRYGDRVKVYTVGDFSREICGGPHVARSGLVGRFELQKEEASSKGVRRIRATVGDDARIPTPVPIAPRS